MRAKYRFHPAAIAEAEEARDWYAERSLQAAAAFLEELDQAIQSVIDSPEQWPSYLHGSRRHLLQRFPFFLVYRIFDEDIEIIAVEHGKRKPGYWQDR